MTVTRILLLVVLAVFAAAPARAQTLDDRLRTDVDRCRETWPDEESDRALCLFKRMFRRHSRQGFEERYPLEHFLGDPPLRCADDRREVTGRRLSCSTEHLNIAGAPPGQRP